MVQSCQNEVLRQILLLTRFPPALRAVNTLMTGKTPKDPECAALVQALYEVLKDIIPADLINSDEGRYLEGSRLIFGLLLDRARAAKTDAEGEDLRYLWSLKPIDLTCLDTMEAIVVPVRTSRGLVEKGYYQAYRGGGLMSWCCGEEPLEELPLDPTTRRIVLLCGGTAKETTYFDIDSFGDYGKSGEHAGELPDAKTIASLCSSNNFSVVPPTDLPSATAPVLTLDREGSLSVYLDRAPCADPAKE